MSVTAVSFVQFHSMQIYVLDLDNEWTLINWLKIKLLKQIYFYFTTIALSNTHYYNSALIILHGKSCLNSSGSLATNPVFFFMIKTLPFKWTEKKYKWTFAVKVWHVSQIGKLSNHCARKWNLWTIYLLAVTISHVTCWQGFKYKILHWKDRPFWGNRRSFRLLQNSVFT